MSAAGRRGGRKGRQVLTSDQARRMVSIREARKAYRTYHSRCLCFMDPDLEITDDDIPVVLDGRRKNGVRDDMLRADRLHRTPKSSRRSDYLDIFHDAVDSIVSSVETDAATLTTAGFTVTWLLRTLSFMRGLETKEDLGCLHLGPEGRIVTPEPSGVADLGRHFGSGGGMADPWMMLIPGPIGSTNDTRDNR